MVSNPGNRWAVAAGTFVLWGLVAASAVYWGFKLSSAPSSPQAAVALRAPPPADPQAVARLLGAGPAPVAAAAPTLGSRFSLLGVVADRHHEGAALITVDGKPAKPFKVGAVVDAGLVLQAVDARQARLGPSVDGPASLTLELPRPAGNSAPIPAPAVPAAPPNQRAPTAAAR